MSEKILVVRAEEYVQQVGSRAFVGLPREEAERLHGCVEVLAIDRGRAAAEPSFLPLLTFTAIHYNYSWLTFEAGPRSLGIRAPLYADGEAPSFLDDALQASAQRAVESAIALGEPCQWRLAGLIQQDALGLVYVARLPRRIESTLRSSGHGELSMEREQFEPWSRLLIDNLHAF
jgi:hypothetical protein